MKTRLFVIIIAVFAAALSVTCKAQDLRGQFLIIETGDSIHMSSGEKKLLHVKSGILGVPVYKELKFSSTNALVAHADRSGVLRAGFCGRARITVFDKNGRTGSILVIVSGRAKAGTVCCALVIFAAAAIFFLTKNKTGRPGCR